MINKAILQDFTIAGLIIISLSGLMLYLTDVIPAVGEWYSYDQTLRMQTEAILHGELAIQHVPYGHHHDWAWGNGMHHVWGLGVPILRLPFHVIGHLLGFFSFPDRITFLIFYVSVAVIFWRSLSSGNKKEYKEVWQRVILGVPVIVFAFLNPAFIAAIRSRFMTYEEVIAYAYLWALLLIALLILFIKNRRSYLYIIICLFSGFSIYIRPTTGAYGLMTFILSSYLVPERKMRYIGFFLFAALCVSLGITNYLRFGDPLEFGHRLLLASGGVGYLVKFGSPAGWYPFTASAIELYSALFFIDFHKHGENGIKLYNEFRLLGLEFKLYDSTTLILLITGWLVALMACVRKKSAPLENPVKREIMMAVLIWSSGSFLMLFLFYARWPFLLSRYLVDFGPAIIAGIMLLYFYAINFLRKELPNWFLLNSTIGVALLAWCLFTLVRIEIRTNNREEVYNEVERANVATAKIAHSKLAEMTHTSGPPLPAGYYCGDQEWSYGIPYNNKGWNISGDCSPEWSTIHFLSGPKCVEIVIEPDAGINSYSDNEIQVRMGLETLRRSSYATYDGRKAITYCSQKTEGADTSYSKIKMISIKWINLDAGASLPPIKLISLRKIEPPKI